MSLNRLSGGREAAGFTADIIRRASWARDHNDSRPEPAWSTGERLAVALVLGDQATLDAEGYTRQQAEQRLAGDLAFYGYPRDTDAWLAGTRNSVRVQPGHDTDLEAPQPASTRPDPGSQASAKPHPAARWHELRDADPHRRALYTTVKDDHPPVGPRDEPCACEQGDTRWEAHAMRVTLSAPAGLGGRPVTKHAPAGQRDCDAEITARVLAELEAGTCPWRQPWRAAGPPRSISTGGRYTGINVLLLGMPGRHASPYWGTYQAVQHAGGQVRRGEHGTRIAFFKELRKNQPNEITGEIETVRVPLLRLYTVFNASQADGLPACYHPEPGDFTPDATAEQVIASYLTASGAPTLLHDVHGQAHYRPADHTVHLAPPGEHISAAAYYSTCFHELTHSTGPALGRRDNTTVRPFGSHAYGREELCAEMGASFLLAETGTENPSTLQNNAAYLRSWLDTIREDTHMVISAAAAAQRAADLILEPSRQAQPEGQPPPEPGHADLAPAREADRDPEAAA